jgi:hypothetical protein
MRLAVIDACELPNPAFLADEGGRAGARRLSAATLAARRRMMPEDLAHFGEPNLRIGGLRIWVHGRQFPESDDYWDGNWLMVTAFYRSPRSWVSVEGPIIHGPEFAHLLEECERLYSSLAGAATLPCIEPNLRLAMKGNGRGQIDVEVVITPDHMKEAHTYHEEIDQTHLPPILQACRAVLSAYPIKGAANRAGG